jgi:hypothetical protein
MTAVGDVVETCRTRDHLLLQLLSLHITTRNNKNNMQTRNTSLSLGTFELLCFQQFPFQILTSSMN